MMMLPRVPQVRREHVEPVREVELLKGMVARHVLVEHAARETFASMMAAQHEADELRVQHPLHADVTSRSADDAARTSSRHSSTWCSMNCSSREDRHNTATRRALDWFCASLSSRLERGGACRPQV